MATPTVSPRLTDEERAAKVAQALAKIKEVRALIEKRRSLLRELIRHTEQELSALDETQRRVTLVHKRISKGEL